MHLRLYGGAGAFISAGTRPEMRFTVSTVEEDKAAEVTFTEVQELEEEQEQWRSKQTQKKWPGPWMHVGFKKILGLIKNNTMPYLVESFGIPGAAVVS